MVHHRSENPASAGCALDITLKILEISVKAIKGDVITAMRASSTVLLAVCLSLLIPEVLGGSVKTLAWVSVGIYQRRILRKELIVNGTMEVRPLALMEGNYSLVAIRISWVNKDVKVLVSGADVAIEGKGWFYVIGKPFSLKILILGSGKLFMHVEALTLLEKLKVELAPEMEHLVARFQLKHNFTTVASSDDLLMVIGFRSPTNVVIEEILGPRGLPIRYSDPSIALYSLGSQVIISNKTLFKGCYVVRARELDLFIPRTYLMAKEVRSVRRVHVLTKDSPIVFRHRESGFLLLDVSYVPFNASIIVDGGAPLYRGILREPIRAGRIIVLGYKANVTLRTDSALPVYSEVEVAKVALYPPGGGKGDIVIRYPEKLSARTKNQPLLLSPFIIVLREGEILNSMFQGEKFSITLLDAEGRALSNVSVLLRLYNITGLKLKPSKESRLTKNVTLCGLEVVKLNAFFRKVEILNAWIINPPNEVLVRCPVYDVELMLKDLHGALVDDATIRLYALPERVLIVRKKVEGGLVKLKDMPSGEYEVQVIAGQRLALRTILELTASGLYTLDCPLFDARFRVVTGDLEPLEDAKVVLCDHNGDVLFVGVTDEKGFAVLRQIPLGKYWVKVLWDDIVVCGRYVVFDISNYTAAVACISSIYRLEVLVEDLRGSPLKGATVRVFSEEYGVKVSEKSNAAGIAVLYRIPAGKYYLEVALGRASVRRNIMLERSMTVKVRLPVVFQLGPIVIVESDIPLLLIVPVVVAIIFIIRRRAGPTIVIR